MKDGTYQFDQQALLIEAEHTSGYWEEQFHGTDVLVNGNMIGRFLRKTVLLYLKHI